MGKLILCATPIGNLEDMSPRAVRVLGEADIVACEDTRRTRKLLSLQGVTVRSLVVLNEANERRKAPELVRSIAAGRTVVLVSDAGMPGLSDPGYRLVKQCAAEGLDVSVVPGPSAILSAVSISGLPTGRFAFEGFIPRKASDRRRKLEELRDERRTMVFFEAPHRVVASLRDLAEIFGPRPAVIARELTKMHEEVRRGTLAQLADEAERDPPRGEIVLVIEGAIHDHAAKASKEELALRARVLMEEGLERKEALQQVARDAGVPKREVFDALLEEKPD